MKDSSLDTSTIFKIILIHRKTLFIVTFVSAIIAAITSLLLPNQYESTVILFPTTTNSISKALMSDNPGTKTDILRLGEEEQVEQLLQILHSNGIFDLVNTKYNLIKHYNISSDDKHRFTQLKKQYNSNISFEKTKFGSIEIAVLDLNADTAALIANDISSFVDTVKNNMRRTIALEAFQIVDEAYNDQKNYIESLEDSLAILRSLGVVDYESQVERLTEQWGSAILQNKKQAAKTLQEQLDMLKKHGGAYISIRDQLEFEKKRFTTLHQQRNAAKIDADKNVQHKFIVDVAYPAEKKKYPIRWLIVVVSAAATFFLMLILLLFKQAIKNN